MKKDAFTNTAGPLPQMTACHGCGRNGEREDEFFILVGDKWTCRECFEKGPGRSWPRGRRNWPKLARPRENVGTPAQVPTFRDGEARSKDDERADKLRALRRRE